uniref:Zinc finger CCHC domain-containing protein 7 n=1 Tax=Pavo cristatus TaxID=9049 RepID=A0A8C9FMM1_PAVCR
MFYECEDTEESDVYEDELYREESSSEPSIDSEVEFHLYSQVHYSQNLAEISSLEASEEAEGVAGFTDQSSGLTVTPLEDKSIVELPDCDGQISDDPEIIVLSDTPEEDSVYKSKAQNGRLTSVSSGPLTVQEVMVIDDSSNDEEESMISESDNVESWMLLGCSTDDKDEDIMLNLEGCGTPIGEG